MMFFLKSFDLLLVQDLISLLEVVLISVVVSVVVDIVVGVVESKKEERRMNENEWKCMRKSEGK